LESSQPPPAGCSAWAAARTTSTRTAIGRPSRSWSPRRSTTRASRSPRGASAPGPVELIVTNLTDDARELTLETTEIGGTGGGIEQSTGQINPGTTAQLKAELKQGRYAIIVDGAGTTPLRVGAPRPSAQDQLLQP
jgi:hypothetical protein